MTRLHDPRVLVVANAISQRIEDDLMEDMTTGSVELAEVAIDVLDRWLIERYHEARRAGLPNPRLYGHKFCDCSELVNRIIQGDKP